jgi:hypothetical protein
MARSAIQAHTRQGEANRVQRGVGAKPPWKRAQSLPGGECEASLEGTISLPAYRAAYPWVHTPSSSCLCEKRSDDRVAYPEGKQSPSLTPHQLRPILPTVVFTSVYTEYHVP